MRPAPLADNKPCTPRRSRAPRIADARLQYVRARRHCGYHSISGARELQGRSLNLSGPCDCVSRTSPPPAPPRPCPLREPRTAPSPRSDAPPAACSSAEASDRSAGVEGTAAAARQEAAQGFDAALVEMATSEEDSERFTEAVLSAMLGPLYVRHDALEILDEIGEGGFATVHLARLRHDNGMTQMVAVKRLRVARLDSPEDLREFIAVRRPRSHRPFVCFGVWG